MASVFGLVFCLMVGWAIYASAADQPVTLTWDPNTETDLAGYGIYQSTVSGQYGAPVATVGTVTQYTFTLPERVTEQRYYFTLTAYDVAGNESLKSNEVTKFVAGIPVIEPPGTGALTVVSPAPTQLVVSWPAVADGVGGQAQIDLRLGRPGDHWGMMLSQSCTVSPCLLTGLTPGTAYVLQAVWYLGTLGSAIFGALSPVVSVSTLIDLPPVAPTGLTITSLSASKIVIVASARDCTRVITSTKGSTTWQAQRTITCVR